MSGKVLGLGVGPGDPELITIKALRLLRAAAVVAYPAPESGASFARAVVARWLSPAQREIVVRMPIESARFPAQAVYDEAARRLAVELDGGRDVAVLCQGDPFFYGSFMYLFGRLAERFAVEVVPGVSSLTACAAASRWPLAAREDALIVLPATLSEQQLTCRLAEVEAAAIIKLGRHFAKVRGVLDAVDAASVPYFSMILVHRRGAAWR